MAKLPALVDILVTMCDPLKPVTDEKVKITLATMYAMAMNSRNQQASAIQRVYSALVMDNNVDNTCTVSLLIKSVIHTKYIAKCRKLHSTISSVKETA